MRSLLLCRALVLLLLSCVCGAVRAAPFVNLNFEQATVPPGSQLFLPAPLAFPGWTPAIGGVPIATVHYNNPSIGEAAVVLYDEPLGLGGFPVLEGSFSAALFTDVAFGSRASLAQVGDVPAGIRSIRLLAPRFWDPPIVSLNDTVIPLVALSTPIGPDDPILYGGDVTAYGGASSAELRFSSGPLPLLRVVGFDAAFFSETPIPEPTVGLVAMSLLLSSSCRAAYPRTSRRPRRSSSTSTCRDAFDRRA